MKKTAARIYGSGSSPIALQILSGRVPAQREHPHQFIQYLSFCFPFLQIIQDKGSYTFLKSSLPSFFPSFRLSILKLIHPFFPFLHISHSNLFTDFNLADPTVQFLNPRTAASGRLCFRGMFYVMKQLYQLPAYSLRHSSMGISAVRVIL